MLFRSRWRVTIWHILNNCSVHPYRTVYFGGCPVEGKGQSPPALCFSAMVLRLLFSVQINGSQATKPYVPPLREMQGQRTQQGFKEVFVLRYGSLREFFFTLRDTYTWFVMVGAGSGPLGPDGLGRLWQSSRVHFRRPLSAVNSLLHSTTAVCSKSGRNGASNPSNSMLAVC